MSASAIDHKLIPRAGYFRIADNPTGTARSSGNQFRPFRRDDQEKRKYRLRVLPEFIFNMQQFVAEVLSHNDAVGL